MYHRLTIRHPRHGDFIHMARLKLQCTPRTSLMVVLIVAVLARLLAQLSLPLIITNDSVGYLGWSLELLHGTWPDFPPTRTPGYPLLLWCVFTCLSPTSWAIALVHHAAGVLVAASVWKITHDIAHSRVALLVGLLVALDPWLIGFESYALSDSLCVLLVVLPLACLSGNRSRLLAVLAGVVLGLGVLTRPSLMAWIPGLLLVSLLGTKLSLSRSLAFAVACVLSIAPWLWYNSSRGVGGLAETEGLALWGGLARSGLLSQDVEIPLEVKPEVERLLAGETGEGLVMGIYTELGQIEGFDRGAFLGSWSRTSLDRDPFGYAQGVVHASAWQANSILPGSPYRYDHTKWMMRRLGGEDAMEGVPPNFATRHERDWLDGFAGGEPRGPVAWLYRAMPGGALGLSPQLLGAMATGIACVVLLRRREFQAAALLASSFPIVIGHALLLQPFSRYSLSAWPVWWIGVGVLCWIAWAHASRFVCHSVSQRRDDDRGCDR